MHDIRSVRYHIVSTVFGNLQELKVLQKTEHNQILSKELVLDKSTEKFNIDCNRKQSCLKIAFK